MWPLFLMLASAHALVPDFKPYLPSTCERVEERGQECWTREARTEDGYLLSMHRIHSPGLGYGPPVLLIHGLLSASDQWLVYGRDHDLPSILADKGYDVWLGNLRGNVYSRKHVSLNPDTPEFWNFSLHEHGYYDIPAMVDLIRLETGYKKVFYVGYSVGGTIFFMMGAARPDYNAKIRTAMIIAPYVFTPVKLSKIVQAVFNIIFSVMNVIYDVISTFRSGSSAKVLNHVAQIMYTNSLKYYDYENEEENLKAYGHNSPPEYNLTKITAPVSLHYSAEDNFMNTESVEQLGKKLPNFIGSFVIPTPKFNHLDYLAGIHARELVYEDIFTIISKY